MKQAIISTRFSPRPNADECLSCERQEERCQAFCKSSGYAVKAVEHDRCASGGGLNRPGLAAAINALKSGDVLVVDCSDRLARDMLTSLTIRHEVERQGATIEYADGSPVDTTPEGELFQNMLAAFAAYERARIRARLKRWAAKKKAKGEWMGKPPVGWMIDPDDSAQLIENSTERQAITRACDLKQDGYPSIVIANILSEEFGPCRGRPWSDRTVRRLVKRYAR